MSPSIEGWPQTTAAPTRDDGLNQTKLLREALDAHWLIPTANVTCRCGWIGPNDGEKDKRWADHREAAVKEALIQSGWRAPE